MYTQFTVTTSPDSRSVATKRADLATRCSHFVTGNNSLPYYNTDDQFWVLDQNNDWFIRFYEEDPNSFSIEHRYNDENARRAISTWIAYRLGGKLTEKTS